MWSRAEDLAVVSVALSLSEAFNAAQARGDYAAPAQYQELGRQLQVLHARGHKERSATDCRERLKTLVEEYLSLGTRAPCADLVAKLVDAVPGFVCSVRGDPRPRPAVLLSPSPVTPSPVASPDASPIIKEVGLHRTPAPPSSPKMIYTGHRPRAPAPLAGASSSWKAPRPPSSSTFIFSGHRPQAPQP